MAKYILDTASLIDYAKGHEPTKSLVLNLLKGEDEVGVCAITIAEFYSGLTDKAMLEWDEFFDTLTYWETDIQTAKLAGKFRRDFAQKENRILPLADTVIAAVAYLNDATIITRNIKDFPEKEVKLKPVDAG